MPPVRAVRVTRLSASVRPGNDELAAVRHHRRPHHGDAEELLCLAFAAADGGAALRRFVRQEVPGRDPKPGGGNEADGGQAAGFHRALSLMSNTRAGLVGRLGRAAAQHVARDVHEDRKHGFRVEIGIERAAPPHPVGDDHQHGDDAVEIDVAGNIAALGRGAQQVAEPLPHVGVEGGRDAGDVGMATRLGHDLGAQQHLLALAARRSNGAPGPRARRTGRGRGRRAQTAAPTSARSRSAIPAMRASLEGK